MKKKNLNLALLGFASISLILASCQQAPSPSENSESTISDSTLPPDDDNSSVTENKIKLTSPAKDAEFQITPSALMDYVNAKTEEEQISKILAAKETKNQDLTCTSVKLSWEKDGSANYTLFIADNEDFNDARIVKVSSLSNTYEAYNLIPNKTYFWKVKGTRMQDTSEVSTFKTIGTSVRFIKASGAANIRDLGGWQAGEDTIQYGKLYRGGLLNNYSGSTGLDDNGKKTFNEELGIKTEIDLRKSDKDDGGQVSCYFDSSKTYIRAQLGQYNRILDPESFAKSYEKENYGALVKDNYSTSDANDGISVRSLRTIFDTLSDEENYPVYFHCNAGADRTGTLSFLIESLLGVSYEDTIRDFELTSFSHFGERLRSALTSDNSSFDESGVYMDVKGQNYVGFGKLHDDLLTYYGEGKSDISLAVSNYLIRYVGIAPSTIQKVKNILLGTANDVVSLSTRQEFVLTGDTLQLDLSEASLDEGSVESISLCDVDLGKDPNAIAMSKIRDMNVAGEREIVVKGKKDGKDVTIYVPILLISKVITDVAEFTALDTYRVDKTTNYGYYRLANDIGSVSSPVSHGGYLSEQTNDNGAFGFRGTIDGNGKTVYVRPTYGGLFSVVGGGAILKNITFAATTINSSAVNPLLGASLCGAIIENATFSVLSNGWGDKYQTSLFTSGLGLISSNVTHGTLLKDVTIHSEFPIMSLFGGLSYEGVGGLEFDNVTLNCRELAYIGIKRATNTKQVALSDCILPFEVPGAKGSYSTSKIETISLKKGKSYASVDLENRYGAMELADLTYNGKKIKDAVLESNLLIFSVKETLDEGASSSGTLTAKLLKDGLTCSYSIPVSFVD